MICGGSLFSGAGMLDHAVAQVLGVTTVWWCEHEPPTAKNPTPNQAAARLLAHRYPAVPNLGDITEVDWAAVEPVEVLTGGFPCTDVSSAGTRAGLRPGTRSGLWSHMAYAISVLHPELVVIENVRGLLSSDAHCDLEPCPWCVGDNEGRPLRALGSLLGDLADLGYDTRWCGLRASDVGAPHGRFRVFVIAQPAGHRRWAERLADSVGPVRGGRARRWRPGSADRDQLAVADPASPRRGPLQPLDVDENSGTPVRCGQTQPRRCGGVAADANGERLEGSGPVESAESGGRRPVHPDRPAAADPQGDGRRKGGAESAGQLGGPDVAQRRDVAATEWGPYGPAIRRWELILGRAAPGPTVTGKRGGQQLAADFVEWLMGWPLGHVCAVPGLSRNDKLKICGNGVVPQQAVAAISHLLQPERSP